WRAARRASRRSERRTGAKRVRSSPSTPVTKTGSGWTGMDEVGTDSSNRPVFRTHPQVQDQVSAVTRVIARESLGPPTSLVKRHGSVARQELRQAIWHS